ncbi:WD40/YVTN/BNR-like repeat-containing protein [Lederbergia lenta]|uniref:WD40/YVTN/BNR-like repeat-containing protein n=1 Tax=Lederbergia lenta TaxID=1467 RepID=UPI0020426B18|nr:oxidoreductase [Lederbergia lenta]
MKNTLLSLSGVIVIALIIATVIYERSSNEVTYPHLVQLNNVLDNQKSQNEPERPLSEQLHPINMNDTISYTLQNNELNITYNKGKDWIKAPITKDQLFAGEYNGDEQELIENSYILTEDRAAFLYSNEERILLTYSLDQGNTWEEAVVTEPFPSMRFRKVDFLTDHFGYAIITGDRTMSQESSHVFLTQDGGLSWNETNTSGVTRLISDGGFLDESTGFLSFGTINPEKPDLYVTQDAGSTWSEATIILPENYNEIFVSAEIPEKEGNHLAILVNQGPNGDYEGGKVKGKFISKDNGTTWEFLKEVQPNETE